MKCQTCLYETETYVGNCPACGVLQESPESLLTEEEKKVKVAAKKIRQVAYVNFLGAGFCLIALVWILVNGPAMFRDQWGRIDTSAYRVQGFSTVSFGALELMIGFGLLRYERWAYVAQMTLCILGLGMFLALARLRPDLAVRKGWYPLMAILVLSYLGNKTARSLFNRTRARG